MTINILIILKQQKLIGMFWILWISRGPSFEIFSELLSVQGRVGLVGLNGWWEAWWASRARGWHRIGSPGGASPACIGAGTPGTLAGSLLAPNIAINNQPDRRATRPGQPAMFVLARPQWPALFTCLPLAATMPQAQPALLGWGQ